jgi:hypothetical protein
MTNPLDGGRNFARAQHLRNEQMHLIIPMLILLLIVTIWVILFSSGWRWDDRAEVVFLTLTEKQKTLRID